MTGTFYFARENESVKDSIRLQAAVELMDELNFCELRLKWTQVQEVCDSHLNINSFFSIENACQKREAKLK